MSRNIGEISKNAGENPHHPGFDNQFLELVPPEIDPK